ncbi:MAG: hemerythrin family protein [Phycisphaerae bacterium]|nr:hemerythrin family protein [Phycisphaerae bacterium]
MKIKWDKSIGVGVPQLDEDHKRLVDILNYIDAHQSDDVKSETVSLVMEQIREFASSHFRREEKYMQSIDYPEYDSHKILHKQFREKTAALCIDVMNHKKTTPQNIYHFLHNWVLEHMLHADKQIQAFVEAKQACKETV